MGNNIKLKEIANCTVNEVLTSVSSRTSYSHDVKITRIQEIKLERPIKTVKLILRTYLICKMGSRLIKKSGVITTLL